MIDLMCLLLIGSGKKLWQVSSGEVVSQAVALPDLQGDSVPDLLIASVDQVNTTHTHTRAICISQGL